MNGMFEASLLFAVDVALKATLLLAIVALAVAALSRSGAAARHFIATAGLIGALALPPLALVLPRVEVPLWAPLFASKPHEASLSLKKNTARDGLATETSGAPASPVPGPDRVSAASVEKTVPVSPARPFPWRALVLAAWAAGAVLVASRLAVGLARVRSFRREASEIRDDDWSEEVRTLARRLEVARPVSLFESGRIPVAVTSGLVRPFLLLSRQARQWGAERRRVVLMHELAHVKRTDWIWLVLAETAFAFYWWHPLAWVLTAQVRRDAEKASDDLVLAAGTKPSVYAGHLLGIFRSLSAAAHPVALALASDRPSHFEGRLRSILDPAAGRRALPRFQSALSAASFAAAAAGLAVFSPWAPACSEAAVQNTRAHAPSGVPSPATCTNHQKGVKAAAVQDPAEPAAPEPGEEMEPIPGSGGSIPAVLKAIDAIRSSAVGFVRAANRSKKDADESGASWYSRAMDLHNDERYDEAIAAFQKAIAAGYREGASSYNIACGYALKGDRDRAFEWLRRAEEAGFDVASHLGHDDDLDGLRSDPRWKEIRKAALENPSSRQEREASQAVRKYERLTSSAPKSGEPFFESGKELLNARRFDLSAKAFQASADRGYRAGTSLYNEACALSRAGKTREALDLLQKALDAGFDQPRMFATDDDLDNLRGEPRFAELSREARDLSLPGSSFEIAARSALQKIEDYASSWSRSRWRESSGKFEEYARAHPQNGRAWFNLGYASLQAGRPEKAAEAFQKALNLDYRRPTTMYNLACSYARLDQKDKAFDWLFQALAAGFDGTGMLRSDEDLDNLRGDSRFRKALDIARAREEDRDGD